LSPAPSPKRRRAKATRVAAPTAANPLLVDLVTELAALLLAAGIGAEEFEHASKIGFVTAASRIARLGNSRINKSAIAAMTGLSRAEVRKLSTAGPDIETSVTRRQRALRVVDGWRSDSDFSDPVGVPLPLSLQKSKTDFELLVRRYSGDIPPRAILRELDRLGLVTVDSNSVQLKKLDTDERTVRRLENASLILAPLLAKLAEKGALNSGRMVGRELSIAVPDMKAHRLLHKQLNDAIKSFFLNIQNAADGASLPRNKKRRTVDRKTHISVIVLD